jgi:hypothetical protein
METRALASEPLVRSRHWQRSPNMTMTGLFNNGFGGKLPGFFVFGGEAYGGGFHKTQVEFHGKTPIPLIHFATIWQK